MRILLISFSCSMILFGLTSHSAAEINNRIVAIVNNDVITLYELEEKIVEITGLSSDDIKAQNEERYIEIRRQIQDQLINEKITRAKILELGIQVTEAEIDSYIENIKAANKLTQESLIDQLAAEGLTYEKFRKNIKENLERDQLIEYEVISKTIIREEHIIKYYHDHIDDYKIDEQVYLAGIFLMQNNPNDKEESAELLKKGEEILSRLNNGEDFSDLAKEFSQGPGAEDGGNLGAFKISQLDNYLQDLLEQLPEGGISKPIEREKSIQIIKLIRRDEPEIRPFEEVRDMIYEKLYSEEINKRYISWINDLRENSYIKIIF